jgi:hypothetical protein
MLEKATHDWSKNDQLGFSTKYFPIDALPSYDQRKDLGRKTVAAPFRVR